MKIVRIHSDQQGESHFGTMEIELRSVDFAPPAPPLNVSSGIATTQMVAIGVPTGWLGDWHPAPRKQYWVGVSGEIDVTVGDGETRRFGPGSLVLLEDVTGRGHRTVAVGNDQIYGLFVQVLEGSA